MKELDYIHFKKREEFRTWLQENHGKGSGFWLIFFKKDSGKECIKYREALEEALCFGWIDSIIKKIDKEKYCRKFTPRKDIRKWSEINKKIVIELIRNGKMTRAGLNKIKSYLKNGKVEWEIIIPKGKSNKELDIPEFITKELAWNEPALKYFKKLSPSHKRQYILWITNAKKEETVQKRLKEAIGLLKNNEKLGLK
jgi:uncharacterized protein YdeI (YjbR/CyaY-like superfamily)